MYGKVFASIFNSSLAADGGWLPTYIFMSMIALSDKDGIVDLAPKALFRRLGFREYDSKVSYQEFLKAISYLEADDPDSNSTAENGKRIVKRSETDTGGNRGWLIVNYLVYRQKASKEEPKGASTERVRRFRERNKNNNLHEGNGKVTESNDEKRDCNGHTDTDTDTDTKKKNASALPDWLDKEAWATWNDHRAELRKKQTAKSIASQLRFLEKYKADHTAILDQSVRNGWTGLFELKADYRKPEPSRTVKDFPA
jgi:rubrerythrin